MQAGARCRVPVAKQTIEGVEMSTLQLPGETGINPSIGVKDDILIFTTSPPFAAEALSLLASPSGNSKFDDPRVVEALSHLPKAEDSLVVFDGLALAKQLRGIPTFIQKVANGQPDAERVIGLLDDILKQTEAIDYEIMVEYTEGFQNRSMTLGRLRENASDTVVGKMLMHQQPFENWSRLVPSATKGFSLSGGCTLLPLYNWLMEEIPARFPESQKGLDKFAEIQEQFDLHLKEDILETFSGEMVSVTLPGTPSPFGGKGSKSVTMLRCSKPDRIQELLHRALNALNEIPQVRAQGIGLKEVPSLEGFEELTSQVFGMVGLRPVIGFSDGWMVLGSHRDAVETVFDTAADDADNWAVSDRFKEFSLKIDGPVRSLSYSNTGESIREISTGLQQAGIFAPMVIGMIGAQNQNGEGPDLTVIQEIVGLLPPIGRIIGKFDFIDATMSVCQPGEQPGTYTRQSVTLIRPPKDLKSASGASSDNGTETSKSPDAK